MIRTSQLVPLVHTHPLVYMYINAEFILKEMKYMSMCRH